MENDNFEKLLDQYSPLLHGTLRDLYIYADDNNYEDYLQELRVKLITIASKFEGDPIDKDKYRFTSYAKQGLKWFMIDMLRKAKNISNEISLADITFVSGEDVSTLLEETRDSLYQFLTEVEDRLNKKELTLFWAILSEHYTLSELSKHFKVSRKTISLRKRKLLDKLKPLKDILKMKM